MENTTVKTSQVEEQSQAKKVNIGDLFVHKTNMNVSFCLVNVSENNEVHGRRVDNEGKPLDVYFLATEVLFETKGE